MTSSPPPNTPVPGVRIVRYLTPADLAASMRTDVRAGLTAGEGSAASRGIDTAWIAVGLSLLATIYPSLRASRVNPAEALRYE